MAVMSVVAIQQIFGLAMAGLEVYQDLRAAWVSDHPGDAGALPDTAEIIAGLGADSQALKDKVAAKLAGRIPPGGPVGG